MQIKGRTWSVIGWCESLPADWQKRLKDSNLQVIVSPLHDSDIQEATGEIQKPHYHIVLNWDGPTTLQCVRDFAVEMGLGTYIERVRNISNLLNYLTHDSYMGKGKAHYDVNDITYLNCCSSDFIKIGFRQVIEYIRLHKIKQFSKLVNSLLDDNENDILEYVANHSYYVNTYLCSLKEDISKQLSESYALVKDLANQLDDKGRFTLDRENYCKLLDLFEQLDIWADDL